MAECAILREAQGRAKAPPPKLQAPPAKLPPNKVPASSTEVLGITTKPQNLAVKAQPTVAVAGYAAPRIKEPPIKAPPVKAPPQVHIGTAFPQPTGHAGQHTVITTRRLPEKSPPGLPPAFVVPPATTTREFVQPSDLIAVPKDRLGHGIRSKSVTRKEGRQLDQYGNVIFENEKFMGPPTRYSFEIHERKMGTECRWKFNPDMKVLEDHDPRVPAVFLNPAKYPPIPGFMWLQKSGSRVSRNTHVRDIFKEKEQWGAIVFWPRLGSQGSFNELVLSKSLPLDTVYVQGVNSVIATSVLLEEFSIWGAIEAAARKQESGEDRMYVWIQYEKWQSAWNAVAHMHGRHVFDQDIEVMFSDRNINIRLADTARFGKDIWEMV